SHLETFHERNVHAVISRTRKDTFPGVSNAAGRRQCKGASVEPSGDWRWIRQPPISNNVRPVRSTPEAADIGGQRRCQRWAGVGSPDSRNFPSSEEGVGSAGKLMRPALSVRKRV